MTVNDFWKSFTIYMCIKYFDAAWHEVSQTNMNCVWKALCTKFVNSAQGFDQEEPKKILENLVEIFEKLDIGLETTSKSCSSRSQELTNEVKVRKRKRNGIGNHAGTRR